MIYYVDDEDVPGLPWSPARVLTDLFDEIDRMSAVVGARGKLPYIGMIRDMAYPFIGIDDDGVFHWIAIERNIEVGHRQTADRGEILYWALEDTTSVLASNWKLEHPRRGQEQRVTGWIRQFDLLYKLNPAWAQRCRQELADTLGDVPDAGIPPLPGPV
ncbi:Imm63 family immunity protein [Actinoplanes awajinensis]|uniref:Immunity protein 63 domain-containing protein n=1 Tax=Actinoplanes awajinensis subsp. mycoplanecinus TaxID=135947 RepID=A0A0X3V6K8_9ACTN|nr:Imm63 family immunity protein [Actinoplanes awajinensis]KUL40441.1 hypothetical protein ADL15_07420 [Actinoplanes awajinensis subsp. mycoplanecinus]